jgi:tetratricopeptide (TPR) repeat protein
MSGAGDIGGVAYTAHAAGYVFGITIAFLLIMLKILPRNDFDLLYLMRHRYRREKFRRLTARGADPFLSRWGSGMLTKDKKGGKPETVPGESELRNRIREALNRHDTSAAANSYLELCEILDRPILPQQSMLDIANQLAADKKHSEAVELYENLLEKYPNYPGAGDIHLMLGLIYGRYLQQDDKAEACLARALESVDDPARLKMAEQDLEEIRKRRSGKTDVD